MDVELRQAERDAGTGDKEAVARLKALRLRAGLCKECGQLKKFGNYCFPCLFEYLKDIDVKIKKSQDLGTPISIIHDEVILLGDVVVGENE